MGEGRGGRWGVQVQSGRVEQRNMVDDTIVTECKLQLGQSRSVKTVHLDISNKQMLYFCYFSLLVLHELMNILLLEALTGTQISWSKINYIFLFRNF